VPPVSAALVAAGRTVAEPRLSPDGALVAFVSVDDGRSRLVVVDAAGGPERVVGVDPAPYAARGLGGGAFDWMPDGSALVVAGRAGGLWRQPVSGGRGALLHEVEPAAAPTVSPDATKVAYVVDAHHVEVLDIATGGVTRRSDADFVADPAWSTTGQLAWIEWDVPAMPWDSSRLLVDGEVVAGGEGVQVQQPRFSPDGSRLGYLSDETGWLNLTILDLATHEVLRLEEAFEHGGPTWGPGQRSWAWSPQGDEVVVCRNERGFGSLVRWRPGGGDPEPVARAVHGAVSWRHGRIAAVRTGARTPTQVVTYEGTERRTLAIGPVALGDDAHLPEPELVEWGDGVPGRLYRGRSDAPAPLIVWVHGGPTDQWPVEWRPRFTYWLDRGWNILVPDHRGSTGHGRAFTQALRHQWGVADVEDVIAGIDAAHRNGWGDPRGTVVMGGSAGGFTVLNVLATAPGLCAAGVDLFGVADLVGLAQVDYRYEAHYTHSLVGPLPEAHDTYEARSPVHRAHAITDPLLVLQGDQDEVVPLEQSRQMVERLTELGRTVELHVYEGEGHGWGRSATVVDELQRTDAFLERHVLRRIAQ
jgi:dipeptidyl aminopeptidase/acylaminoacyl peptidase